MKNSGFTIIESLVAISVLVFTIMGVMTAVQSGISSYIYSKDQITAFYLAQEAVEQVRNMRDENRLNSANWLTGLTAVGSDPCYFNHACTVSPVESSVATRCASPGLCPNLRQSPSTGFLGYDPSWTATVFRREVEFEPINDNEVAVIVTVNWSKGLVNRQFIARENLLNW